MENKEYLEKKEIRLQAIKDFMNSGEVFEFMNYSDNYKFENDKLLHYSIDNKKWMVSNISIQQLLNFNNSMRRIVNEVQYPEIGTAFYYIIENGNVHSHRYDGNITTKTLFAVGNYFLNRKDAEKAKNEFLKLMSKNVPRVEKYIEV